MTGTPLVRAARRGEKSCLVQINPFPEPEHPFELALTFKRVLQSAVPPGALVRGAAVSPVPILGFTVPMLVIELGNPDGVPETFTVTLKVVPPGVPSTVKVKFKPKQLPHPLTPKTAVSARLDRGASSNIAVSRIPATTNRFHNIT